jgi:predicted transcriptional regulator of viral defense system
MKKRSLSDFLDNLQADGRYCFEKKEAGRNLHVSNIALKSALRRLEKKRRITAVRRGFYVIVPIEYRAKGILPPSWFIDDFMKFLNRPYYVGLLSAAAIHGAAHQQPQEFHVVTTKAERVIQVHGLVIRFFVKSVMEKTPTSLIKTETGYFRISNPAATAFDLVRYTDRVGGLERVTTVLQELGESIDGDRLVEVAKYTPP